MSATTWGVAISVAKGPKWSDTGVYVRLSIYESLHKLMYVFTTKLEPFITPPLIVNPHIISQSGRTHRRISQVDSLAVVKLSISQRASLCWFVGGSRLLLSGACLPLLAAVPPPSAKVEQAVPAGDWRGRPAHRGQVVDSLLVRTRAVVRSLHLVYLLVHEGVARVLQTS